MILRRITLAAAVASLIACAQKEQPSADSLYPPGAVMPLDTTLATPASPESTMRISEPLPASTRPRSGTPAVKPDTTPAKVDTPPRRDSVIRFPLRRVPVIPDTSRDTTKPPG